MLKRSHELKTLDDGRSRRRFVLWFFAVGSIVPVVLMIVGALLGPKYGDAGPGGHGGSILWVLTWVIWPTWILMLDAEHLNTIIFMLLFAAPLNGLWYGAVGFLVWQLRMKLKELGSRKGTRS